MTEQELNRIDKMIAALETAFVYQLWRSQYWKREDELRKPMQQLRDLAQALFVDQKLRRK